MSVNNSRSLLNPIVPHISETLFGQLTGGDILEAPWPELDEGALARDEIDIVFK